MQREETWVNVNFGELDDWSSRIVCMCVCMYEEGIYVQATFSTK